MRASDSLAPIELDAEEFRRLGHDLVDGIADFLRTLPERRVAPGETAEEVRAALGRGGLPEHGMPADELLADAARLFFEHSTFNGHPRFLAYITSSAAPIGALGDPRSTRTSAAGTCRRSHPSSRRRRSAGSPS